MLYQRLYPFITLARLNKPIPILLILLPCLWGVALNHPFTEIDFWVNLVRFSFGAIFLRSAGCIYNDIVDAPFDKHVTRTKNRPLASAQLTQKQAWGAFIVFCALGASIFLSLSFRAQIMSLLGFGLLLIYPWMKRITFWPQAVLGLAFNIGVIVAHYQTPVAPLWQALTLYIIGIMWTLAYDTIYAFQDIHDDRRLGLKSTAIRFQHHPKPFIGICYSFMFILLLVLSFSTQRFGLAAITLTLAVFIFYRLKQLAINDTYACGRFFLFNQIVGWSVLGGLIMHY